MSNLQGAMHALCLAPGQIIFIYIYIASDESEEPIMAQCSGHT